MPSNATERLALLGLTTMSKPDRPPAAADSWSVYWRLLSYTGKYWFFFLISLLGFAAYAATQVALAHMMKYFVDGLEGKDAALIYLVPVAVVVISLVRGAGFFAGNYYLARVSLGVVNDLRKQMFDHMLVLPSAFHDRKNSGELVSMITYNVNQVSAAASQAIKILFREGFTVVGFLVYLLWQNWQLTMAFVLVAPVLGALVAYASKLFRRLSEKMQSTMGQVTHVSNEAIQGYRLVRSYGGEHYEQRRFHQASDENTRQGLKFSKVQAIQTPVLQSIVALALAAIMFFVLYLASTTAATAGDLVAYVVAAGMIAKPIRNLSEVNATIQRGLAAAESIFMLLDEAVEVQSGSREIERASGRIEFCNVSFGYQPDERVLHDINLVIEPGETVAIVGRSGSGKSTLASLLLRFYECSSGTIQLDGSDIGELKIDCLRRQIALVNQQVTLFNDTIANNIAYGQLASVDAGALEDAAEKAQALDFIRQQPGGFDAIVGEDGTRLSGGQRQRIAIARALLKDAPVLVLDEATSALDTESERNIQGALEAVMAGRTTIVIAHRLSTVEKADRIVVMDQGVIVEQGSHSELMAKAGQYAKLYAMQFAEEDLST
ncbi:MAG: subfamily B ATP-binding cassette protein MsbA [Paraglaciecola psychrophila]